MNMMKLITTILLSTVYFADRMDIELKKRIHRICLETLTDRANAAKKSMDDAQESANSEEKNSSGDKYETGRAMGQLDRDMFAKQLAQAGEEIKVIKNLNPDIVFTEAERGALVSLESGMIYIAAAVGPVKSEQGKVNAISVTSPIAQAIKGKKAGEFFELNGQSHRILDIC